MDAKEAQDQVAAALWKVLYAKQPHIKEAVEELREVARVPDVELYLDVAINSDKSVDYVAELIVLARAPVPRLSRAELISLVEKIMRSEGSEAQVDTWVEWFKANITHPAGTDLIFYPEGDAAPTPEQIVDKGLTFDAGSTPD